MPRQRARPAGSTPQRLGADTSTALIPALRISSSLDHGHGALNGLPAWALFPLLSPSCCHLCHLPGEQL